MRFILITAAAVLLHVLLGWEWTILAGVFAGLWFRRRAWLIGFVIVGADWLLLVAYNAVVDLQALGTMTATVGALLGNLPSAAIVALTVVIGAVIGAIGGAVGSQIRILVVRDRRPVPQA